MPLGADYTASQEKNMSLYAAGHLNSVAAAAAKAAAASRVSR